jgi:hypothetical protein
MARLNTRSFPCYCGNCSAERGVASVLRSTAVKKVVPILITRVEKAFVCLAAILNVRNVRVLFIMAKRYPVRNSQFLKAVGCRSRVPIQIKAKRAAAISATAIGCSSLNGWYVLWRSRCYMDAQWCGCCLRACAGFSFFTRTGYRQKRFIRHQAGYDSWVESIWYYKFMV